MIAAVLASHPSLSSTWPDAQLRPDVVLAVNVAATLYPCDWWVAGDPEAFDWWPPIAPPVRGVVTDALNYKRKPWWKQTAGEVQRWCDFRAPFGSGQWNTSGPTAVGFAALVLGATEIHCYGMDLAGAVDLDGQSAGAPSRWPQESAELAAIVAASRAMVVRHLADGSAIESIPPPPPIIAPARRCGWCGRLSVRAGRCGACGWRG